MPLRVLGAAILLGLLASAASAAGVVRTIVIDNMAFGPAPAVLHVGDTLEWVNRDLLQHTATARDGRFDLVLPPKKRGRVVLRQPGVVSVYCRYHPGMKLMLKVVK